MKKFLTTFAKDERGVSALEYAILAGAIGAVVTTAFAADGAFATGLITKLTQALNLGTG